MIIALMGKPGAGKSSVARAVAEMCCRMEHISSGELAREMADKADMLKLADGELFNEEKMRSAIGRSIYNVLFDGKDVILDGFPRSVDQMKWLTEKFNSRFIIVNLECVTEDIIKRLTVRGRLDDNSDAIRKRISHYTTFANEIYDSGLISQDLETGKFKLISVTSDNNRTIQSVACEVMDRICELCEEEIS